MGKYIKETSQSDDSWASVAVTLPMQTSTAGPEALPQQVAPVNKHGANSIPEVFNKVETLHKLYKYQSPAHSSFCCKSRTQMHRTWPHSSINTNTRTALKYPYMALTGYQFSVLHMDQYFTNSVCNMRPW